jgi:hypothetical protein
VPSPAPVSSDPGRSGGLALFPGRFDPVRRVWHERRVVMAAELEPEHSKTRGLCVISVSLAIQEQLSGFELLRKMNSLPILVHISACDAFDAFEKRMITSIGFAGYSICLLIRATR